MSASRPSEVHASAFSDFMRWTCVRLQNLLASAVFFGAYLCSDRLHASHLVAMTGFEPALRTPWMFRRLPIGLHGHEKWWIQWDSNSHYTAPQAVDSANWSMDPLRRHDSFFTIPQTSPRILDLHQKRLLRLLGKLLLVNWGDLEMVPILQVSTLLPLQRSGLLLCCQRTELTIQPRSITRVSRHWDW